MAVTSGESQLDRGGRARDQLTFVMLVLVYMGAIVVLTGVMPWNHTGVTESPFVTVFRTVRIPGAVHLMNFVVLTAALSGANAALYAASRTLFSLARNGWAPECWAGSIPPARRAARSSCPRCQSAWRSCSNGGRPQQAFVSILNAALFGLLLSWLVTLAAHARFRRTATPANRRAAASIAARRRRLGGRLRPDRARHPQDLVGFAACASGAASPICSC